MLLKLKMSIVEKGNGFVDVCADIIEQSDTITSTGRTIVLYSKNDFSIRSVRRPEISDKTFYIGGATERTGKSNSRYFRSMYEYMFYLHILTTGLISIGENYVE